MRSVAVFVIGFLLGVVVVTTNASPAPFVISSEIVSEKSQSIMVTAFYDNGNGTSTLELYACGSLIKVVVSKEVIDSEEGSKLSVEFEQAVQAAINKACGEG